jgi:serine kinase of HPr protein (carbohydrate metabolism regulator)
MPIDLKEFIKEIDGEVLTPKIDLESIEISDGYVADLLSDVMGNAKENQVWITIMKHLNSVAVASLANIPCIVYPKGIKPDQEVIDRAIEENVCLISSKLSSFSTAGILYMLLHR